MEFPVSTKHYRRIEAQNKVNINVFGNENKQFFPVYISAGGHEELNLLLISDEEKHLYVLIKSFNSLMRNHTKHHGTKEFCMHCLQAFSTKKKCWLNIRKTASESTESKVFRCLRREVRSSFKITTGRC